MNHVELSLGPVPPSLYHVPVRELKLNLDVNSHSERKDENNFETFFNINEAPPTPTFNAIVFKTHSCPPKHKKKND
jgi:hypothetical protein